MARRRHGRHLDGEWTERSNGIYNVVSDVMLIHAARLLKRPELLVPVRANLKMMTYLVHPDGKSSRNIPDGRITVTVLICRGTSCRL